MARPWARPSLSRGQPRPRERAVGTWPREHGFRVSCVSEHSRRGLGSVPSACTPACLPVRRSRTPSRGAVRCEGTRTVQVCKNRLKKASPPASPGARGMRPPLPREGSCPGRARPTPGRGGGAAGPRRSMQREAGRRGVGVPRGAGSQLRLVAGLGVAGSQPAAAAALPALRAAGHVRQGVGADEVPAGVGEPCTLSSARAGGGRGVCSWGERGTHTMSLGSSLVSGGGLMRT